MEVWICKICGYWENTSDHCKICGADKSFAYGNESKDEDEVKQNFNKDQDWE